MLSVNRSYGFWNLFCVCSSLPGPNFGFGISLMTCVRHFFARSTHTLHYWASFFSLFCPNWSHWGAPRAQNSIKDYCFSTFFDTAKIAPRLSKATLGPPKEAPREGIFFARGPCGPSGPPNIFVSLPFFVDFGPRKGRTAP